MVGIQVDSIAFLCGAQFIRKKSPVATPGADLTQPPQKAISRKPLPGKDIAFRTRFGPGPNKTENQGPNRESRAGKREKSGNQRMVLKDGKCAKGLEYKGKKKTLPPGERSRRDGLSTEFWWRRRPLNANQSLSYHSS